MARRQNKQPVLTYKIKLKPTKEQEQILHQHLFDCWRLYNSMIEYSKHLYENYTMSYFKPSQIKLASKLLFYPMDTFKTAPSGESSSLYVSWSICLSAVLNANISEIPYARKIIADELKNVRKEFPEYGAIGYDTLGYIPQRLDQAYMDYFRNIPKMRAKVAQAEPKDKADLQAKFVKFISKGVRFQKFKNFTSMMFRGRSCKIDVENRLISMPTGAKHPNFVIKTVKDRLPPEGARINTIEVVKQIDGWFACICFDVPEDMQRNRLPKTGKDAGFDLGIEKFIQPNDAPPVLNELPLKKYMYKLKALEDEKHRRVPGSRRYKEVERRISKLHLKVKRIRKNFHHTTSYWLLQEYDELYFEDLKPSQMARRPKPKKSKEHEGYEHNGAAQKATLNRNILDSGWGQFMNILETKAKHHNKEIRKVDPRYTSKNCSSIGCDYVKHDLPLSVREWQCPECGVLHDRDVNAAKNILQRGRKKYGKA
jgi:putative transposase